MHIMDQKCMMLISKYFIQNPPDQNNEDNFFQLMAKKIDESESHESFQSFLDENLTISARTILDEATIDCLLSEIKDVAPKSLSSNEPMSLFHDMKAKVFNRVLENTIERAQDQKIRAKCI